MIIEITNKVPGIHQSIRYFSCYLPILTLINKVFPYVTRILIMIACYILVINYLTLEKLFK